MNTLCSGESCRGWGGLVIGLLHLFQSFQVTLVGLLRSNESLSVCVCVCEHGYVYVGACECVNV